MTSPAEARERIAAYVDNSDPTTLFGGDRIDTAEKFVGGLRHDNELRFSDLVAVTRSFTAMNAVCTAARDYFDVADGYCAGDKDFMEQELRTALARLKGGG